MGKMKIIGLIFHAVKIDYKNLNLRFIMIN